MRKTEWKMGHKVPNVEKAGSGSLSQLIQMFKSGTGNCRGLVQAYCILRTYFVR